ncbi:MAG: class IV adenylate cyclase [Anaerolineales bacterium]|nr:class IV adenylate cyclase [Anaerolineales bacterium]
MNRQEKPAALEQEVKFLLEDTAELRRRLAILGARPYQPRMHEANIRFDTADGTLTRARKVLRLRKAGPVILTYKEPEAAAPAESPAPARRSLETEIVVDNLEKTAHLLQSLGFRPIVRYEKYREVFQWKSVLLMFDQLPFGDFLELEGPDLTDLRHTAGQLGLDWSQALQTSYMGIFLLLKKTYHLTSLEATFTTFTGWDPKKTAPVLATLPHEGLYDRKKT